MGTHGYRLHRKDRSVVRNKKGGGVALYVRSNMVSVEWEELNIKHCERLWVRLYVNDVDFIVVGVCYRSPDADENEISQLFET